MLDFMFDDWCVINEANHGDEKTLCRLTFYQLRDLHQRKEHQPAPVTPIC